MSDKTWSDEAQAEAEGLEHDTEPPAEDESSREAREDAYANLAKQPEGHDMNCGCEKCGKKVSVPEGLDMEKVEEARKKFDERVERGRAENEADFAALRKLGGETAGEGERLNVAAIQGSEKTLTASVAPESSLRHLMFP